MYWWRKSCYDGMWPWYFEEYTGILYISDSDKKFCNGQFTFRFIFQILHLCIDMNIVPLVATWIKRCNEAQHTHTQIIIHDRGCSINSKIINCYLATMFFVQFYILYIFSMCFLYVHVCLYMCLNKWTFIH